MLDTASRSTSTPLNATLGRATAGGDAALAASRADGQPLLLQHVPAEGVAADGHEAWRELDRRELVAPGECTLADAGHVGGAEVEGLEAGCQEGKIANMAKRRREGDDAQR